MSATRRVSEAKRTCRRHRGIDANDPSRTLVGDSDIGRLWNIEEYSARQSGLMPANLITLLHFSVSSAMCFAKPAGDSASIVPPSSASRALILGSKRPALISLLSLSTISGGVLLGAPIPCQPLPS